MPITYKGGFCQTRVIQLLNKLFTLQIHIEEVKTSSVTGCALLKEPEMIDGDITLIKMPEIIRYLGVKGGCSCMQGSNEQKKKVVEGLNQAEQLRIALNAVRRGIAEKAEQMVLVDRKAEAKAMLESWNKEFEGKKYFLGEEVSLADCFSASFLTFFFPKLVSSATASEKYPNLLAEIKTFYDDVIVAEELFGILEFAESDIL